jgi:DNA mismatch repair ATPase MutS
MVLMSHARGRAHLFTSFPEKRLSKFVGLIVEKGYKVAIIEQVETSRECKLRNEKGLAETVGLPEEMSKEARERAENVSRREIVQIISRGTLTMVEDDQAESFGSDSRYVLTVFPNVENLATDKADDDSKQEGFEIGVCFFDITTLQCNIGSFVDGASFVKLRNLMSQIKPLEIVYEKKTVKGDILRMIKAYKQQSSCLLTEIHEDKFLPIGRVQVMIGNHVYNAADEQR